MEKIFNGRKVNIPDAEIDNLCKTLDISVEEAIDVWATDNNFDVNEEQEELDAKASQVKISKKAAGTKERKARPPRKADETKRDIIQRLFEAFVDEEGVEITNPEREVSFVLNGESYSITLTRHRAK